MRKPVFLLAPDSFKGSMTAMQACLVMERGIKSVFPEAECIKVLMADGGEGTLQAIMDNTDGHIYKESVTSPLGYRIVAEYGITGDGLVGVVEMASASGLHLVNEDTRNPLITTTYGTGELVKACLDRGVKKIILGIGGSATNDGGAGFFQAMGAEFKDADGNILPYGGAALINLDFIDLSGLERRLNDVEIVVASDVMNPLCGQKGASAVFAPQKGATPEMVKLLDEALYHYAEVIEKVTGRSVKDIAGAGAAGGLGAGLLAFTNAKPEKGIDVVTGITKLAEKVKKADVVFTGEGAIDAQTQYGKTPYGVGLIAKEAGKPVIALAGSVSYESYNLYSDVFDAMYSIVPELYTIEQAKKEGMRNLENTMINIMKTMKLGEDLWCSNEK